MQRALVSLLILVQSLAASLAFADPPGPGDGVPGASASRPGAAALGAGTIFLTRTAIRAPESGTVFLSGGQLLPSLDQPVGSCRLKLRVASGQVPSGTPLTVESVASTTSPYEERGISSVTWRFGKDDPAESLLCDVVGNAGPAQYEVEAEVRGVLQIEAANPPPD